MRLWVLLWDYIRFYVAATLANYGLLFDRHRKKQSYCFSFQLPVHPDHGTWVLRMPRILIQHSSGGGEDWGIRVWGTVLRLWVILFYDSQATCIFCATELNWIALNSCCHFQLHFPIKSKLQCQKQRSLTPVLSFSSRLPDFLYLCCSVLPGPHYHVSSLMYISCAHLHRNHCKRTTDLQCFLK